MELNKWKHACFSRDGSDLIFYIDGQNAGEFTIYQSRAIASLEIGQDTLTSIGGIDEFPGQIDEVKIWNYALTAEQIKNEYGGGAVRFGD